MVWSRLKLAGRNIHNLLWYDRLINNTQQNQKKYCLNVIIQIEI